jgi:hypothetical protein
MCGDFNVVPHSMPYNFLTTGHVPHSDPAFALSVAGQAKLVDHDVHSPFALKRCVLLAARFFLFFFFISSLSG